MSAIETSEDDVIGIDEACRRAHRSRAQFFVWRCNPTFPPIQKTKHGLKGYSWAAVVRWMVANRQWIRHWAGDPDLDQLDESVRASTPNPERNGIDSAASTRVADDATRVSLTAPSDTASSINFTRTRSAVLEGACPTCNLRETVFSELATTRKG